MMGVKAQTVDRKPTTADQSRSFAIVLQEEFGTPFRVFDPRSDRPRPGSGDRNDGDLPLAAWDLSGDPASLAAREGAEVSARPGGNYRVVLSFHDEEGKPALLAVGEITPLARTPADAAQELGRMRKWAHSVHERLRLAARSPGRHRGDAARDRDNEAQTSAPWEAILRVEHLLRHLRIDKEPERNRKRVLRAAAELVGVQAAAWVPSRNDEAVVIEGERLLSPWDLGQLVHQLLKTPDWESTGYVLRNDVANAGWSARFPLVHNVLALPVSDRTLTGWVILLNKTGSYAPAVQGEPDATADARSERPEPGDTGQGAPCLRFRRADAALLTPFAALIGCLGRASQRYSYLKNLLVGLTRALTSAIDAKDSYTYGHSERVARVAVEIGRELGLQEDELSDIYLAGLLHDIGKIGIRDSVLCKRGPLTDEEFEHIKEHVTIGYRILADLRPIAHLLPGVLYHHERYDGKGYPEGLSGNAIPFLARILAVADSYDAMSTSRPYRSALPVARTEAILTEGAGTQWDAKVIDAFLRCKDRVHAVRQRGVGESLCNALDDALRKGANMNDNSSVKRRQG